MKNISLGCVVGVKKTRAAHSFFNAKQRILVRYFYIKNNQFIILYIIEPYTGKKRA